MSQAKIVFAVKPQKSDLAARASVLLIDGEKAVADSISESLQREGFRVLVATDGDGGIEAFRSNPPALVLLDLVLPGISGLDVCRTLRSESLVPIVILSARDSEADKVLGLELGADDYITKPFSTRELVSRVRAHIRRADRFPGASSSKILTGGPVEVDVDRHEVHVLGRAVDLAPKEFELLVELLLTKGRMRTRNYLITRIWGEHYVGDTKTLDVHVKRLRTKIERDPHHPQYLVTVRGLGYRFLDEAGPAPSWGEISGSESA